MFVHLVVGMVKCHLYYVCALGCWEEPNLKPWGIKKDCVQYMTEVVLTNVVI